MNTKKPIGEFLGSQPGREGQRIMRIDGWCNGCQAPSYAVPLDEKGRAITGKETYEFLDGAQMRLLIDRVTPVTEIVVLLQRTIDLLTKGTLVPYDAEKLSTCSYCGCQSEHADIIPF